MSVQGHRVVSTTGVRCVGNVLHIANRTYSPPYVIEAVGAGDGDGPPALYDLGDVQLQPDDDDRQEVCDQQCGEPPARSRSVEDVDRQRERGW